jgi:hypothetical protein
MHELRLEYNHELVPSAKRFDPKFGRKGCSLVYIDDQVLGLPMDGFHPFLMRKISLLSFDKVPPFVQIGISIFLFWSDEERKGKVEVRMLQVLYSLTGVANSATILFRSICAVEILRISQSHGITTTPRRPREQLGMRHNTSAKGIL